MAPGAVREWAPVVLGDIMTVLGLVVDKPTMPEYPRTEVGDPAAPGARMMEATLVRLAALVTPKVGRVVVFRTPGGAGAIGRGAAEELPRLLEGMLGFKAKD